MIFPLKHTFAQMALKDISIKTSLSYTQTSDFTNNFTKKMIW